MHAKLRVDIYLMQYMLKIKKQGDFEYYYRILKNMSQGKNIWSIYIKTINYFLDFVAKIIKYQLLESNLN